MKWFDNAEVLYCDNHLLVALKPAGLLTQPDQLTSRMSKDVEPNSLEDFCKGWVKNEYQKKGNVFLHPIHRLDRPVSGLVLFARTSKALSRLNEQSRRQEIQRIYAAEVEGILSKKEGKLDHYLIHGDHRALLAKEGEKDAKHARLTYLTRKTKTATTLVEIELETGRYHQIRAQFSAIGHPIVGDSRYGSKMSAEHPGLNGGLALQEEKKIIHLHCEKLSFKHPVTGELLSFESAAPFV